MCFIPFRLWFKCNVPAPQKLEVFLGSDAHRAPLPFPLGPPSSYAQHTPANARVQGLRTITKGKRHAKHPLDGAPVELS